MAIFGSRRRAASNPPRYSSQLINNTTPSAASAAALAFTTNQDKTNGGLSSAAAAAALRSHTSSPVPVGQIQTKRMVRKMSNSSVGSSRPGLTRSGSSGSMTERTFRSPSPASGLNGRANLSNVRKAEVPPVPPIPSSVKGSHRRAASLEPTMRIASPGPRTHGRGQSLDRGPRGAPTLANAAPSTPTRPASAAGAAAMKSSPASASTKAAKLANVNELQRSDSRSSVNFSRPMSPTREGSATNTRPPVPIAAQEVNPDAPAPKKKKKKRPVSEGDALVAANAIPASSTTTTAPAARQGPPPSPSSASARAIAERVLAAPLSNQTNVQPITSDIDANTSKKLDPPTTNGSVTSHRRVASDGDAALSSKSGVARAQSLSPSRKPHFSSRPIDLESSERHKPLRGVSPAKSALKHSPSPSIRAESPLPISEDVGSAKKKKSVRVSFDEPRELPAAAIAATKAVDTTASKRDVEDFDDVLKPTPALPSFSSARGNRRDTTESMDTSVSTLVNEEHSKDQMVGSLLAANLAAQQAAEIKTETPLPPKTTSVEAADIATSESDLKEPAVNLPEKTSEQEIQAQQAAKIAENMAVPDIAVLPATPGTETGEPTLSPSLAIPGTYRESTEVDQAALAAKIAEEEALEKGEVHHAITTEEPVPSPTAVTAAHIAEEEEKEEETEAEATETEGSSDDAMYSDAAEDLDENETGFVSLNAILEMPAEHNLETPPAPAIPRADPLATASTSAPVEAEAPRTASDWDAATEYWKSLSAQKRTELEAQMRGQKLEEEETAATATRSEMPASSTTAQVAKPKKKKKVVQDAELASAAAAPIAAVAAAPALKSAMKKPKEQTTAERGVPSMKRTLRGPTIVDDSSEGETQPHVMQKSLRGPRPTKTSPSPRKAAPPVESNLATSMHAPKESRSALTKKTMRRTSSDSVPAGIEVPLAKPTLVRSNSAGSDSSFKRSRRRPASSAGDAPISLRRSMRAPPAPAATQERPMSPVRSSRWSIRSSSPARSETGSRMRMSLRSGSVDAGNRSLRGPKKEKSGGLFGFGGRSSRANSVAGSDIGSPPPSATRSRFINDSDDDDRGSVMSGAVGPSPVKPAKKAFKSRFADDSDDDMPSPAVERPAPISTTSAAAPALMSPVRGIPRRAGQQDGDSSDLSDDSDAGMGESVINAKRRSQQQQQQRERVATKPPVPSLRDIESSMTNGVNHHHHEGSALAAGTMRSSSDIKREELRPTSKKSGLKGLMSSKHAPPPSSANRMTSPAPQPASMPNTPQRPGQKRRLSGVFGFGSSPKNKGGRSSSTPPTQQSYFTGGGPPVPPLPSDVVNNKTSTPKLQRRSTPNAIPTVDDVSINAGTPLTEWPLSIPRPGFSRGASGMSGFSLRSNNNRPETSDGINLRATMRRPDVGKRRSTADQSLGDGLSSSKYAPGRHVGFDDGTIGGDDGAGAPKVTQLSDLNYAYGKTGKKKRFQGLRKVFGLRD